MPTVNQLRLLPIADEDLFEDFCRDLWAMEWRDPNAQRNGRKGQAQLGVDVYGIPEGTGGYEAVQAKAIVSPLTNKQIQHEIDEAKKFSPPIKRLVIACASPRDARGQEYVRKIQLDHKQQNLFSVSLLGWEDIVQLIQTHFVGQRPDLLEKYFELTSSSQSILTGVREEVDRVITEVSERARVLAVQNNLPGDLPTQDRFHQELNYARTLVNTNKPRQALQYLERLKADIWPQAEARARYRILHYSGAAHYMLGQIAEASNSFIEAFQYSSGDDVALVFTAIGYQLAGDKAKATDLAQQALAKNPNNEKAYTVLIQTSEAAAFSDVLLLVPERYREQPEVANALAFGARVRGELLEAERWSSLAISRSKDKNWEFYGGLGEILLTHAAGPVIHPTFFQLTPVKADLLKRASKAFSVALEQLKGTELEAEHTGWLINRAFCHWLLGDLASAREDLEAVRRFRPDDVVVIQRLAQVAVEQGDTTTARQLLASHQPPIENSHASLFHAGMLFESGAYEEAEDMLTRLLATQPEPILTRHAREILLDIALSRKDLARAGELHALIKVDCPADVRVLAQEAGLARLSGRSDEARDTLRNADSLINSETHSVDIAAIAGEWYMLGEYEEAGKHYARIADLDSDSATTMRLLLCYFRAGDLGNALSLGQRLLRLYGPLQGASEIVAAIYDEAGDLNNASRIASEYLDSHPNDLQMQLRLANICLRLRDTSGVDRFLNSSLDYASMSLEMTRRVVNLLVYRGRTVEAIQRLYEVLRRFDDDETAHLAYVTTVFQIPATPEIDALLRKDRVEVGTAVHIRDRDGNHDWYIIENRPDRRPPEIDAESKLAQQLLGKIAGDTVILKQDELVSETAVVVEVKSKYLYALHESLRTFQRRFPEAEGLRSFRVGGDTTSPALSDFQPIFDLITQQHEHDLQVQQLYVQGALPLGVVARLTGGDIIGAWSRARYRSTVGVRCSTGNQAETNAALQRIADSPKLVLEPISLLTLYSLKSRDDIAAQFGLFAIPQTLYDWLQTELAHSRTRSGSGYATIGREGEQFVREEFTAEDIERRIAYMEALIAWVDGHCSVHPVEAVFRTSRNYREHLEEMMHPAFVEAMLLAAEPELLLYTDDLALRQLSLGEVHQDGVWTQVLLERLRNNRIISEEQYVEDVVQLVCSNYRHTHINADVVIAAARKADWNPVYPFTKVIEVLSASQCDPGSAIVVAVEAIYRLWLQQILPHQRANLLIPLLDQLCVGRNGRQMLAELQRQLRRRFNLNPIGLTDVLQSVAAWSITHIF